MAVFRVSSFVKCTKTVLPAWVATAGTDECRLGRQSRSRRSGGPGSMHVTQRRIYCRCRVSGTAMPC